MEEDNLDYLPPKVGPVDISEESFDGCEVAWYFSGCYSLQESWVDDWQSMPLNLLTLSEIAGLDGSPCRRQLVWVRYTRYVMIHTAKVLPRLDLVVGIDESKEMRGDDGGQQRKVMTSKLL